LSFKVYLIAQHCDAIRLGEGSNKPSDDRAARHCHGDVHAHYVAERGANRARGGGACGEVGGNSRGQELGFGTATTAIVVATSDCLLIVYPSTSFASAAAVVVIDWLVGAELSYLVQWEAANVRYSSHGSVEGCLLGLHTLRVVSDCLSVF
jgi:hypothetical protein